MEAGESFVLAENMVAGTTTISPGELA